MAAFIPMATEQETAPGEAAPNTMSDAYRTRTVKIKNSQGLHARPAELFVRCATQFASTIQVNKGGVHADAKSMLEVLTLAAAQGTELVLKAEGDDADAALDALAELVNNEFAVNGNKDSESST